MSASSASVSVSTDQYSLETYYQMEKSVHTAKFYGYGFPILLNFKRKIDLPCMLELLSNMSQCRSQLRSGSKESSDLAFVDCVLVSKGGRSQ